MEVTNPVRNQGKNLVKSWFILLMEEQLPENYHQQSSHLHPSEWLSLQLGQLTAPPR